MSESSTTSASPSASSSAAASFKAPGNLKVVGIILAISSGVLIGSSFVFKKKGLLRSQAGGVAGEGVAYLKSVLWWTGMIMMILGELCNFAAYAFVEAIVVTPMGALSVVICAILSSLFLNEKLSFFGWLGCALCVIGSVIIALNGPQEQAIGQIKEFQKLFLAPGFLTYGSVLIAASLVIIIYFAPRYGKKSMLWYIMVCSMIGGISVSVTTGLGSAIVTSVMGDNQFKYWFTYFLLVFIAVTLITEVYYLNVALALFNTAMVTPTYYVIFTFFSIITTIVLFQGLKAPVQQIITLVMGFLVICLGITILQLSKVDPTQFKALDRRSTILLQAARNRTEGMDEKSLSAIEDPGMDALRGSFGTIGSIVRARSAKRMSTSSRSAASLRSRHGRQNTDVEQPPPLPSTPSSVAADQGHYGGMKRHQLYDPPVPGQIKTPEIPEIYMGQPESPKPSKKQTIKFDTRDMVHSYHRTGPGKDGRDIGATHETRVALGTPSASAFSSTDALNPPQPRGGTLPPTAEHYEDLRSAPPMLSELSFDDPFFRPYMDPFENSPSTAVLTTFPSVSSSSAAPSQEIDEDFLSPSRNPTSPPGQRRGGSHHSLFGRTPSGRNYPKGDTLDDREESQSLWRRSDDSIDPTSSTVRLVSNQTPQSQQRQQPPRF